MAFALVLAACLAAALAQPASAYYIDYYAYAPVVVWWDWGGPLIGVFFVLVIVGAIVGACRRAAIREAWRRRFAANRQALVVTTATNPYPAAQTTTTTAYPTAQANAYPTATATASNYPVATATAAAPVPTYGATTTNAYPTATAVSAEPVKQ